MDHSNPGLALVFPGQASQHVGMGVELRGASKRADDLFRLAEQITQLPIGKLCADGPLQELTRTEVAQTAVVVTSMAAAVVLQEMLGEPIPAVAAAGHSVGELAAMYAAEALSPETTLRLVHQRGTLMQRDSDRCDGTMVAVLGLTASELEPICRVASREGSQVEVANLNAPGQVILSGDRAAIVRASDAAKEAGARRVMPLTVGGPFHSVYMTEAAHQFEDVVSAAQILTPRLPIVLNTSAEPTTDPKALRAELSSQITSPVRWEESIHTLSGLGCSVFAELGPGDVLTGMGRRIVPDAQTFAAGTPDALEKLASLIRDGARHD